jgi:tetratricopeptide (TPR) repeat protein
VALFKATFPGSADIWSAEMIAAIGKGRYEQADSIARSVAMAAKSVRQTARSSLYLANVAELRGQLAEARKWAARQSEVLLQANPTEAQRLGSVLDSAYYDTGLDGNHTRATSTVARGLARVPMSAIPPADRPWGYLYDIAISLRDAALMRQATAGLERDMLATAEDEAGFRARLSAGVAYTEGRWADAIRDVGTAEQRFSIERKLAEYMRGMAWRALGQRDSTIAAFERLIERPDPLLFYDSHFKVEVLQLLGELYEEKGETKLAIDRYSQITQLWDKADPALQPRVKMIRERITKLMAKTG